MKRGEEKILSPREREEDRLSLIFVDRESYSWPRNWFGEGAAQVMSSIVS